MKKLLSILLVLLLITGSACASTQFYMYNALAKMYGAPLLTEDMLMEETEKKIEYVCGNLRIMFGCVNSTEINSAAVYGADSTDFLPACACTAFTLSESSEDAVNFLGNLLYAYMTVKSGKESAYGFFGSMYFTISSSEEGLKFIVGDP